MTWRNFLKSWRDQSGMSLIEIMVVLMIIGIVATLATQQAMKYLDEAKVRTTRIKIRQIEGALNQYKRINGKYPTTEQGLSILVGDHLENADVLKDGWGNDFIYQSPGAGGHKIDIISYGDDGQEGGSGVDADLTNHDSETQAADGG